MKITNYRLHEKGSLRAFFSVTLPSGMILHKCKLFSKPEGNRWIGLPSERFTDKNGQTGYADIVEFTSREACDRFRDEVLAALDKMRPAGPPKAQIPPDDSDITF